MSEPNWQRRLMLALVSAVFVGGAGSVAQAAEVELLNVSYDPTRELYEDFNKAFAEYWKKKTGDTVTIKQSHGGSGKQARAVIDGLAADVVTLALAGDIDADRRERQAAARRTGRSACRNNCCAVHLDHRVPGAQGQSERHQGLGRPGEAGRLRDHAEPQDLRRRALELPGGLGLGQQQPGGSDATAKEFVAQALQERAGARHRRARLAPTTFVAARHRRRAPVLGKRSLARLKELGPDKYRDRRSRRISILAEPSVAVVDKVVLRKGTRAVAEEYLKYLYTPKARRSPRATTTVRAMPKVAAKYAGAVPEDHALVTIKDFGGWAKAQKEHFGDGGVFDQIYIQ